jgi:hypothetical protein
MRADDGRYQGEQKHIQMRTVHVSDPDCTVMKDDTCRAEKERRADDGRYQGEQTLIQMRTASD